MSQGQMIDAGRFNTRLQTAAVVPGNSKALKKSAIPVDALF